MPIFCIQKESWAIVQDSAGGGYEIRTREGVNPTRFPSVRHRPLGESSMAAMNGAVAYVTLIKATRK